MSCVAPYGAPIFWVCPAGDMFYISDRAHTLLSRSDFWGLVLHFCRRSRRGGGNVGIPAFGISIFPSPNHLPLDLHPKVAPPAVCACRGEQWVQSKNKYDSNDHRSAVDRRVRRIRHG